MSTLTDKPQISSTLSPAMLSPADLIVSPWRPDPPDDDDSFAELVQSVRAQGILVPLLVQPAKRAPWEVISGARRLRAALAAELIEVPVLCRADIVDEAHCLAVWLAENLHRRQVDPITEAEAYQRLRQLKWSQQRIADQVGVSQSLISRRLALLELEPDVQSLVSSGAVSPTQARELTFAETPNAQRELAAQIAQGGATYRQLEQQRKPTPTVDALPHRVERGLSQVLAEFAERLPVQLLHVGIRIDPNGLTVRLRDDRRGRPHSVRSLTCSMVGRGKPALWKVHLASGDQVEWAQVESWETKPCPR